MSTQFTFWNVQHGNATYINSPNNKHIVVDLGTGSYSDSNYEFSPLSHLKYNYGVNQLDLLVITHPHRDHIDDILNIDLVSPRVFARPKHIPHSEILSGVSQNDLAKFQKYIALDDYYCGTFSENDPQDPSIPANFGGLEILSFGAITCPTTNFNNQSFIRVFRYASLKVVIPGDNEACSFNELMQSGYFCNTIENADILLAPHHGRDSGFHNDFVTKVNPRIVIISDGAATGTSVTSKYVAKSRGWTVHKRSGGQEERKCLSTRSDGVIKVDIGYENNNNNYLSITVD